MSDNIEYRSAYDNEPKEGTDYYMSKDGYRIMTKSFLTNRGY